jgi:hypothetical protein
MWTAAVDVGGITLCMHGRQFIEQLYTLGVGCAIMGANVSV